MSGEAERLVAPPGLAAVDLPLWLARSHRRLSAERVVTISLDADLTASLPLPVPLLLEGAGFSPPDPAPTNPPAPVDFGAPGSTVGYRARRLHSLPDWVGPGMRALVVGLNPSPASADGGVNFARPGNRFWPAALAAGLVDVDRDPERVLLDCGVGFSDLVKRTTRTARELTSAEFRSGFARLVEVVSWLRPEAVIVVGLAGWRAAVHRKAVAGWQDAPIGPVPVYLMPNTSGLNAGTSLDEFTAHFRAAQQGPS